MVTGFDNYTLAGNGHQVEVLRGGYGNRCAIAVVVPHINV
jgi:hypothetical protein